jgi:quinol monooxygenase YgiN
MNNLEVIARLKIRPGQLEGFKSQAAEILRATREKDTHTLRCDWFIGEGGTQCEIHEMFPNEQGLIEHKMNTIEATAALFRDYASDHHATIYGDVSQDFVDLVTERMGPPTVFAFTQGLESRASVQGGVMGHLEVIAHLKVRPGQLEGFRTQVAEILRLTREKDTQTLRYDWFLNEDETECEVHEAYLSEQGLIEHNQHVVAARDALFRDYAFDHRMSVYGEISQQLSDLGVFLSRWWQRVGRLPRTVATNGQGQRQVGRR